MIDLLKFNQLRNIFTPQPNRMGSFNPTAENIPIQNGMIASPEDRLRELYQPSTDMNNRFRGMIDSFPERENPSLLRKIGAVIAGAGMPNASEAMQVSEQFANAPFYRKLADWNQQIKPVQQAADNERADNTQQRMFAQSIMSNEAAQERLRITEEENKRREILNIKKLEDQQKRTAILDFKARNPNWRFVTEKGGNVFAVNPQNPTQKIDTGIASGSLSDLDRINLQLDAALTRIQAQGDETRETEGVRQTNRLNLESARQKNREALIAERNRTWNLLPSQQRQQIQNNYEQIVRENPAYDEFFEVDPNTGRISLAEESAGGGGFLGTSWGAKPPLPKELRDELLRRLNEGVNSPRSESTTTTRPATNTPDARNPSIPIGTKVGENDARNQAIEILKTQKKPVTEANIKYVMSQLGAK